MALFMLVVGAAVGVGADCLAWSRDLALFLTNVGLLVGAFAFLQTIG